MKLLDALKLPGVQLENEEKAGDGWWEYIMAWRKVRVGAKAKGNK